MCLCVCVHYSGKREQLQQISCDRQSQKYLLSCPFWIKFTNLCCGGFFFPSLSSLQSPSLKALANVPNSTQFFSGLFWATAHPANPCSHSPEGSWPPWPRSYQEYPTQRCPHVEAFCLPLSLCSKALRSFRSLLSWDPGKTNRNLLYLHWPSSYFFLA